MPSIFTHALVGATMAYANRAPVPRAEFIGAAAAMAMVPDLDVIGIPGIELAPAWFGHRGVTHSLAFAVLLGFIAVWWYLAPRWRVERRSWLALFFAAVVASHPLLDMLTNGGAGVRLWLPFRTAGLFFPWRPILVSPIGAHFFSMRGLQTLASEFLWVWLPSLSIATAIYLRRRMQS